MKRLNKKVRASTTLEAIIIMPTILIMIFAIFFAFQIMYQYVVLEYATSYGASRGAMMWQYVIDEDYNFTEGTAGEKVGIYDSIATTLFWGDTSERTQKIEEETRNIINALTLVSGDSVEVSAEYEKSMIDAKIIVSAKQDINVPFEAIMTYISGDNLAIEATSVGSIFDPDEYIRNIDYAKEIGKQISSKTGISDGISKITSYIKGLF